MITLLMLCLMGLIILFILFIGIKIIVSNRIYRREQSAERRHRANIDKVHKKLKNEGFFEED